MSEPVYVIESQWDETQKAEFLRRRRARSYVLLAALGGLGLVIYLITLIKLHGYGPI